MQSEGSQAQNLDGSHFSRSRQSALRNQLDPARGPLDGMPCKSHQLRARASSSRPWEQPGLIRRSVGDAGLTLVAGRGPKTGGNLELGELHREPPYCKPSTGPPASNGSAASRSAKGRVLACKSVWLGSPRSGMGRSKLAGNGRGGLMMKRDDEHGSKKGTGPARASGPTTASGSNG